MMTTEPRTQSTPTVLGPAGRSLPSSSTSFTSSVGTFGPHDSGLSMKKRAELAVMMPWVSVMP